MSQVALDAETSAKISEIILRAALRDLHDSINAIGGVAADDFDRGVNHAVGKALEIIEAKQSEARS